jgi:hypothetical protein
VRPTSCLCTGCHGSGRVALLLFVRSGRRSDAVGDARFLRAMRESEGSDAPGARRNGGRALTPKPGKPIFARRGVPHSYKGPGLPRRRLVVLHIN